MDGMDAMGGRTSSGWLQVLMKVHLSVTLRSLVPWSLVPLRILVLVLTLRAIPPAHWPPSRACRDRPGCIGTILGAVLTFVQPQVPVQFCWRNRDLHAEEDGGAWRGLGVRDTLLGSKQFFLLLIFLTTGQEGGVLTSVSPIRLAMKRA
jgi:hypothetical protein